jgi:hypothetical protein
VQDQVGHHPFRARRNRRGGLRRNRLAPGGLESSDFLAEIPGVVHHDPFLRLARQRLASRWGYFALPILYQDRLVGKLDATADRTAGVLRVDAVHQDVPFSKTMTAAVDGQIKDLARWLGLDLVPAGRP